MVCLYILLKGKWLQKLGFNFHDYVEIDTYEYKIIIPTIIKNVSTIAVGIQIGANTHHQLHVITPQSLRTINTIVKIEQNPGPL